MRPYIWSLTLCLSFLSACNPSPRPVAVLTDASREEVRSKIGWMVEVEGVTEIAKEGDYIRAKNFSAMVVFQNGRSFERSGLRVRVKGVLGEGEHPSGGKYYHIVGAQ